MEIELPVDNPARQRRRPWLEVTLIAGFIVSLLIGIVALLALLLLQNGEETASLTVNPLSTLLPAKISPTLALTQLAGDPAQPLAFQATNAGELETAYAIALFDTVLAGSGRVGLLSQLARRFRSTNDTARAALVYRLLGPTAMLDAKLSSMERGQALTEAAEGLFEAGERDASLDYANQAKLVAVQSPDLLPAQRSQLFDALRPLAKSLGDAQFEQEIDELARNPYLAPTNVLIDSKWSTLGAPVEPDQELAAAIATRQTAARQFAERLALTGGVDVEPERQALENALLLEDQVRANFFQRTLSAGISLHQQFWLLQDRRAWLALKARIALLGFGVSIAPTWEATLDSILQELSVTTANLSAVLEALVNQEAVPLDQAMLRVETQDWLGEQIELGLYPSASAADLGERIRFSQAEMQRLGSPLALPVDYMPEATPAGFRIQALTPG